MLTKFYRLAGKFFGNALNLENYRQKAIVLCPEEEQDVPPVVYLPEHLQRPTRAPHNWTVKDYLARLQKNHIVHAPTLMFPVGAAKIYAGGVWTAKHENYPRSLDLSEKKVKIQLKQAVITDSDSGLMYFGHWMSDVLPSCLIGSPETPSLTIRKPPYRHARHYEELFEIVTIYANRGEIENLHLLSDFSQNSFKLKRYLTLRANIEANLRPAKITYKGVYIARGNAGATRTLLNEREVITHLEKRGFDIIHPEEMTAEQITRRLWGAKFVVAVEGSAYAHAIYSMARDGCFLTLEPPQHFGIIIRDACNCLGIKWGFYVCASGNSMVDGIKFYVDSFPDLDRVIDLLGCSV
jgi:hypothetical protein